MAKKKIFTISFFVISERNFNFISYRHSVDFHMFLPLSEVYDIEHLKIHESGFTPPVMHQGEVFFKGRKRWDLPFSLLRYIREQKPNVLLIHGFVFPLQMLLLRMFISSRIKVVVQHHAEKPFTAPIKRWLQKLAYSKANAYLFASRWLADMFIEAGIVSNANLVHEVMECSGLFTIQDKTAVQNKLGINGGKIFLWVGRLDTNKDPLCVLKAFSKYKHVEKDAKLFMIYGSNDLEQEVKAYIQNVDLGNTVHLIGKVPHRDLGDWFSASDYFIAASHYEGAGVALCEAIGCGCVPVVSDIFSFRSMTDNGKCGFLFKPGDPEALYELLKTLDQHDLAVLREKVLQKFKRDLSHDAIGNRLLKIIEGL